MRVGRSYKQKTEKGTKKGIKKHSKKQTRKQKGGGLADVLPITLPGIWSTAPVTLAATGTTQMPPPLANGGLYTAQQSTGSHASSPFPPTDIARAAEAAAISGIRDVFFHQRPNPLFSQPIAGGWSVTMKGRRRCRT